MMKAHNNIQLMLNIQYVTAGPIDKDTIAKYLVVKKTNRVVTINDMDIPSPLDGPSKSSAFNTHIREPIPGKVENFGLFKLL